MIATVIKGKRHMATITYTTTKDQLFKLQKAFNESRKGSTSIRVDREALGNLLKDHHRLAGALARAGHYEEEAA